MNVRVLVVSIVAGLMMLAGYGATGTDARAIPTAGEVRLFELPEGRAVSMSPDGTKLAVVVPPSTSLCIYDVATEAEISCADLAVLNSGIRTEDVVWSPDSTRLAFGENSFLTLDDGDLWVMDAQTGALANLTDDGYEGALMALSGGDADVTASVEVSPAWTPDGRSITFSSSQIVEGKWRGNVIGQIPADGSEDMEILARVTPEEPGVVYRGTGWSPDGASFYYTLIHTSLDDPENGIWVYDKATGATRQLAVSDDPQAGPLALRAVSPAGDRLLAYYPVGLNQTGFPHTSMLRFVDPGTGAVSPVPEPDPGANDPLFAGTWIATFSPDGRYILQFVGIDPGSRDVWVTDLSTGESTEVASELDRAVPIDYALGPVWGSNGTVFVAYNVVGAYFFSIAGTGIPAPSRPDSASPVAPANTGALTVGADVVTTGIAPVFAGPDPGAAIVATLPPGHMVQVLAGPVENASGVWYPIVDPRSQIIGYVEASRLQ